MKKFVLLFVMVCVMASFSFAGIEWTMNMTSTGKAKQQNNEMVIHLYAQGGNVKQVFEQVKNKTDLFLQGGYWLYKADDDNIYIVNDKDKSYMVLPMDMLLQMTGAMGQLVKIEINNPSVKAEALGEETLLGYPCEHVKIVSDYSMKMKMLFIKSSSNIHMENEIWASTKVPGFKEIHLAFLNKNYKTGFEDLDALIQKEMKAHKNLGIPLKTVTRTVTEVKGKTDETLSNTVVTKIETKNFPESFFEIPSSYKRQEMKGIPSGEGGDEEKSEKKKKKFGIF